MSKIIPFSRYFQKVHPKSGQPTYFVEKLWKGLIQLKPDISEFDTEILKLNILPVIGYKNIQQFQQRLFMIEPKFHTIRAGNRWKVGDKFSPRVWSGKPYCSKQIIIAPDIEIKKIFDIELINSVNSNITGHDRGYWCKVDDVVISELWFNELVKNDGLNWSDFIDWFNLKDNEIFKGQIICWNQNVQYL